LLATCLLELRRLKGNHGKEEPLPILQRALNATRRECHSQTLDSYHRPVTVHSNGLERTHLRISCNIASKTYRLFWIWSLPASFFRSLRMFSSCLLRCDNMSRRSSCMTVLAVSSATWCMIGVSLSSSLCRISASSRRTSSSRNDSTRFHLLRSLFAIGRGIPSSVSTFPACRAQRAHSHVRSQRKRSKLMQRRW